MRVISGLYRRRLLKSLPGMDVRPTADRLRETLFNILCAGNPEALAGSVWLDLYAGTGAVGIEALSRGARTVYFLESSKAAAALIAENLKSLGIGSGFRILKAEVENGLEQLEGSGVTADFVFLDPPYRAQDEYQRILARLAKSELVHAKSVVIAEHEKRFDPGEAFQTLTRSRKIAQGDVALTFYRQMALTIG
jgi:16S rRNA (guanine(966)-N(2))-methyltransferase RsmD